MAESYLRYRQESSATFDLFVRNLPLNRGYLVACGIQDALEFIVSLKFDAGDLAYLKSTNLFSKKLLKYLQNFKFTGDVWAMREGEIFFANEPVIRVTAPIIEAQLIESFLLNTINLQTMIASKASRVVDASGEKGVYDFALRRTHGRDAGLKVSRASFVAGFKGTSCVLAGRTYGIPIAGTMAHSFVMSFKHEMDSFLAYSLTFPDRSILLVDTYDTPKGIDNAIRIGLFLKENNSRLQGIRLDSGDLSGLSKLARKKLDRAGLNYVKIFASGNLDEFKIKDLLKRKAPIDNFGVGTNMGTSQDAPSLDVIYKISEITGESGEFLPTMKLSKAKASYPGRKQVFRLENSGRYIRDIIGLEKEKNAGRRLLRKAIDAGRPVWPKVSLENTRFFVRKNLDKFSPALKQVYPVYKYPVKVSQKLKKMRQDLARKLSERQ